MGKKIDGSDEMEFDRELFGYENEPPKSLCGPALTTEAREEQMMALAVDLAERQLREGTASSQVIVHYLKQASVREKKEQAKLEKEIELLKAKTDMIKSSAKTEELYRNALDAMRRYSGALDRED